MEIKNGEGMLFEKNSGEWRAFFRVSDDDFRIFEGELNDRNKMFETRETRHDALIAWKKITQPTTGFKRKSKFFGIDGLESLIRAEEKNHIVEPDYDFMESLKEIE